MPSRARDFVHFQLRGRGGRPQLKRDPLGRTSMEAHDHSPSNACGIRP